MHILPMDPRFVAPCCEQGEASLDSSLASPEQEGQGGRGWKEESQEGHTLRDAFWVKSMLGTSLCFCRPRSFKRQLLACPWTISRRSAHVAVWRSDFFLWSLNLEVIVQSPLSLRKAMRPELRQAREQAAKERSSSSEMFVVHDQLEG